MIDMSDIAMMIDDSSSNQPVARADDVETASSADLGGSSKYSNENFEDRSGERFHVNSSWTWVSRS